MINSITDPYSKILTSIFQLFNENKLQERERIFLKKQIFKETFEIQEIIKHISLADEESIKEKLLNVVKSQKIQDSGEKNQEAKEGEKIKNFHESEEERKKKVKDLNKKKPFTDHKLPDTLWHQSKSDSENNSSKETPLPLKNRKNVEVRTLTTK